MPSSVISLAASDGAAGEQIAPLVASGLGFRIVDEQVIARAADEAGVTPSEVVGVEQRKSLVARLIDGFPSGGMAIGMSGLVGLPAIDPGSLAPGDDRLRGLIKSAIQDIAATGEVIIVAHAASLALGARSNALRVFITASTETRRDRVARVRGVEVKEAERLVARGDANRADYLKRFYRVRAEDPSLYDLVLNTDQLSPEASADLIVHAARA